MDSGYPYRVGEWTIDPRRCTAQSQEENVRLEPKAVELLSYLTSRPGDVVTRDELLAAVWPGVIVGDEAVTNAIAKLRRALHDDPRSPKLIETIPKRGYRLLATVGTVADSRRTPPTVTRIRLFALVTALLAILAAGVMLTERTAEVATTPAKPGDAFPLPDRPSITVLPFANLSDDQTQEYFVDGLTEDLITDLSRISGLFVIARNSSFTYKGRQLDAQRIGRELGVRFILTGSARRHGQKLRINVNLIDTASGRHIWADRFDGTIDDVFVFQERIATRITDALSVQLTGSEQDYRSFQETLDPAAYEAFLKGWAAYREETPEGFQRAIGHFREAVDLDPAYGRAQAALAAVYWETYQKRWYRRLGISPVYKVWQLANEHLERSMVAPSPLAHKVASAMLTTNRRFDEAVTEAERAIAIDPNDPLGHVALAEALIFSGSPARAHTLITKAMRLDPQVQDTYLLALGKAQFGMDLMTEAAGSLEQVIRHSPDNRLAWMLLISAYGNLGDTDKARGALATLKQLQQKDKLVSFTVAHAREHWPFRLALDRERFLDGLRKAGVAEW